MDNEPTPKPSFSRLSRFGIGFNVALATLAVLALVAMADYLGSRYYLRFQWSTHGTSEVSPQTERILRSLTNRVNAVIFFDTQGEEEDLHAELYSLSSGLLKEYTYVSPNISVRTVDYTRNPGQAEMLLAKHDFASLLAQFRQSESKERNFILFECEGRTKVVPEGQLADIRLEPVPGASEREFNKKMVSFKGELCFTHAILSVAQPRAQKVYFLQGHREHNPQVADHVLGYAKFAHVLKNENNVQWSTFSLLGTNEVPADCQLLIIAGPQLPFLDSELEKIDRYLNQGGRLLALLGYASAEKNSGLERLLAKWNVAVSDKIALDKQNSPTDGSDLFTAGLNSQHEVVKSLLQEGLRVRLVLPRPVGALKTETRETEGPKVVVLATTGENAEEASVRDGKAIRNPFIDAKGILPLIVAVERGTIKGVTERGTRMIVVGDSLCFDNEIIDTAANHYFANLAVNWLLDRPQVLLENLVPRPIEEYKVIMSATQKRQAQWILLGALPCSVLLFGGLVWLRRRS